jgi:HD-like signal output (HDOD) protein
MAADTDCAERGIGVISTRAWELATAFGSPGVSSAVLFKLTAYLQMPPAEIPLDKLSKDILSDSGMTAELMRFANSASFGLRRKITDIAGALRLLGGSRAVSLLLASGIRSAGRSSLRRLPLPLQAWYQMRTILTASVSSVFAEKHYKLSGDTALVLGLLQDMGILVLAKALGTQYVGLIERSRTYGMLRLQAAEREQLQLDHAEVGAALARHWQLPNQLTAPIRHHHDSEEDGNGRGEGLAYVAPMRIGEAFSNLWDNRHPSRHEALTRLLADCPANGSAECQKSLEVAASRAAEVSNMLHLPVPPENELISTCQEILASSNTAANAS